MIFIIIGAVLVAAIFPAVLPIVVAVAVVWALFALLKVLAGSAVGAGSMIASSFNTIAKDTEIRPMSEQESRVARAAWQVERAKTEWVVLRRPTMDEIAIASQRQYSHPYMNNGEKLSFEDAMFEVGKEVGAIVPATTLIPQPDSVATRNVLAPTVDDMFKES